MFRLIYKSTALFPYGAVLSPPNLPAILERSRRRNAELGITGVLVYTGIGFLQVLEGERAAVLGVFEGILVDRRHRSVSVIEMDACPCRRFEGWAMGFLGPSPVLDAELDAAAARLGIAADPEGRPELLRTTLLLIVDAPISLLWRGLDTDATRPGGAGR